MEKSLLTLSMIFAVTGVSFGQELRVNTYVGYVFKDKVNSYYSSNSYFEGQIQDGPRWGAGIEYHIPDRGAIEIQYLRQDTNAPTIYQDGGIMSSQIHNINFDIAINWLMLNGTRYFSLNEIVEPFVGVGFGMGIFNISNPNNDIEDSGTKFAWNIRSGSNFWVADNVAIRIQASFFSSPQAVGGGLYFGTGGIGTGLSSYSTLYQFGFDGGLVFRFPQAAK